ncbi:hypothetical protein, partial [Bradyrhizobium sp. 35]|uniref:hypothetical protein n=1 Tax=Bradyrhizobium sp. 35 TaxID=2782670 RepID=UPI001FF8E195
MIFFFFASIEGRQFPATTIYVQTVSRRNVGDSREGEMVRRHDPAFSRTAGPRSRIRVSFTHTYDAVGERILPSTFCNEAGFGHLRRDFDNALPASMIMDHQGNGEARYHP